MEHCRPGAAHQAPPAPLHSLLQLRHRQASTITPLEVDVLIVDEASMVHLAMMATLLQALPPQARLIILGGRRPAGLGRSRGRAGRPVPRGRRRALPPRHRRLCPGGGRASHPCRFARSARQRLGAKHRHAAPQPALWRADWAAGPGRQSRRCPGRAAGAGHLRRWQPGLPPQRRTEAIWRTALSSDQPSYHDYLHALHAGPQGDHTLWVKKVLQAFERFRLLCAVREGDWA